MIFITTLSIIALSTSSSAAAAAICVPFVLKFKKYLNKKKEIHKMKEFIATEIECLDEDSILFMVCQNDPHMLDDDPSMNRKFVAL